MYQIVMLDSFEGGSTSAGAARPRRAAFSDAEAMRVATKSETMRDIGEGWVVAGIGDSALLVATSIGARQGGKPCD